MFQVGEVAQLFGYRPGQLVVAEIHSYQVGQVAQLRRYRPVQVVPIQGQGGDAVILLVGPDAGPFVEGLIAQPVGIVPPIRAVVAL